MLQIKKLNLEFTVLSIFEIRKIISSILIPNFQLYIFVNVNQGEGGFANCQHLSTRVREGVKNTQNPVNVIDERPYTRNLVHVHTWGYRAKRGFHDLL